MNLKDLLEFIENPSDFVLTYDGHEVKFQDEYGLSCGDNAEWFVAGHEFGAVALIHSRSYESAWEAWIDECPTIPEDELIEAYGIDDSPEMAAWKETHPSPGKTHGYFSPEWSAWCAAKQVEASRILSQWGQDAQDGVRDDYPELIEGYEYQSNASGTGIVDVGHHSCMHEADLDKVEITRKA